VHWHYAASIHPLSKEHFDSRLSSPVNYSTSYGSCSIRASRCTFSTYGNGFKRRFFISSITLNVLNLVLNRFLEGLARDLIDIIIARKEEVKEILEILEVVNDEFHKNIMQRILIDVGIRDLEDIEILSDAIWIKERKNYVEITFWTYDEEHILPKRQLLEMKFNIVVRRS